MKSFSEQGFSLLEVIVVLLIFSFVSALTLDASSHLARVFNRLESVRQEVALERFSTQWLRSVVKSSVAVDRQDLPHVFVGTNRSLKGSTMQPIFGEAGEIAPFFLEIVSAESQTHIEYQQPGFERIKLFIRYEDLVFTYINQRGVKFSKWPPEAGLMGVLPKLVTIEGEEGLPLKIYIEQRRMPVRDLRDVL